MSDKGYNWHLWQELTAGEPDAAAGRPHIENNGTAVFINADELQSWESWERFAKIAATAATMERSKLYSSKLEKTGAKLSGKPEHMIDSDRWQIWLNALINNRLSFDLAKRKAAAERDGMLELLKEYGAALAPHQTGWNDSILFRRDAEADAARKINELADSYF